jgi:hypothetical protein
MSLLIERFPLYEGYDILDVVIKENKRRYPEHMFAVRDITEEVLPRADAILCRDCMIHLRFDLVHKIIKNFVASNTTLLYATTFPDHDNEDLDGWGFRPINLEAPPFDFPAPRELIIEESTGEAYKDKSIGVWHMDSLQTK